MPDFTVRELDELLSHLNRIGNRTAENAITFLMQRLRVAEYKLRMIEDALDSGDSESEEPEHEEAIRILLDIKSYCPWDDDNEGDSWLFTKEEALHPVRIRRP